MLEDKPDLSIVLVQEFVHEHRIILVYKASNFWQFFSSFFLIGENV